MLWIIAVIKLYYVQDLRKISLLEAAKITMQDIIKVIYLVQLMPRAELPKIGIPEVVCLPSRYTMLTLLLLLLLLQPLHLHHRH